MPWSVNLAAFESRVNGARAVLREGRNNLGLLGVAYILLWFRRYHRLCGLG